MHIKAALGIYEYNMNETNRQRTNIPETTYRKDERNNSVQQIKSINLEVKEIKVSYLQKKTGAPKMD